MTPHTKLIEALKEASEELKRCKSDYEKMNDAIEHLPFRIHPFTLGPKSIANTLGKIDEALRIATETTEPDAPQSIRAEAFNEAGNYMEDIANKLDVTAKRCGHNEIGAQAEFEARQLRGLATAIRSLGDRG